MRLLALWILGVWLLPGAYVPAVPAAQARPVVAVEFDLECAIWRSEFDERTPDPGTGLTALDVMHREIAEQLAELLRARYGFLDFRAAHAVEASDHRLRIELRAEDTTKLVRRSFFRLGMDLDGRAHALELEFREPERFHESATADVLRADIPKKFGARLVGDAPVTELFSKVSIGSEVYLLVREDQLDVCFLPFRYEEYCASPATRLVVESTDGIVPLHHGMRGVKVLGGLTLPSAGAAYTDRARGVESSDALLSRHGGSAANRPFKTLAGQSGVVQVEAIYVTSFIAGPCGHPPVPPSELEGLQ